MHSTRDFMRTAIALLLIAGALVALLGCAPRARTGSDELRAAEQTGSAAASEAARAQAASGAAGGGATGSGAGSASSGGSGGSAAPRMSAKDAGALDAELSAIQSELDRLSLPSDSDFDSIGSGLQ